MRFLSTILPAALLAAAAAAALAGEGACIECHGKLVQGRAVHAPVQSGCDACHAAGHKSGPAAACTTCHESSLFEGPVVHGALLAGGCPTCHDPHSSPYQGLLKKPPAQLCLDCHPEVARRPHVVAGMRRGSHPIGAEAKVVRDPLRPGKDFYCVACHEPHRAATPRLTRFGKDAAACRGCHRV